MTADSTTVRARNQSQSQKAKVASSPQKSSTVREEWERALSHCRRFLSRPSRLHTHRGDLRVRYFMDRQHRPRYRGSFIAFLHRSDLWMALCTLYSLIALFTTLSLVSTTLRIIFCLATIWGVWASDWMHNLDRIEYSISAIAEKLRAMRHDPINAVREAVGAVVSLDDDGAGEVLQSRKRSGSVAEVKSMLAKLEDYYFRHDLVSISAILTTAFLVWSENLGWEHGLLLCSVAEALCTLAVLLCVCLFLDLDGLVFASVKLLFAAQFLILHGYLVWVFLTTSCGFYAITWFVYLVGMVCYSIKPFLPDFHRIGPHEIFHAFVISGHVCSMTLDAIHMLRPWLV